MAKKNTTWRAWTMSDGEADLPSTPVLKGGHPPTALKIWRPTRASGAVMVPHPGLTRRSALATLGSSALACSQPLAPPPGAEKKKRTGILATNPPRRRKTI